MYYTGTKRQIAQSIQGYLANWDIQADQAIDIREVYVVLDRLANKYAKLGLFENMRFDDKNVSPCYLTSFPNVQIYLDAQQNICCSDLPARFIQLPHDKGIDAIFPMSNRAKTFKPVPRGFISSFRKSKAKGLQGNDGYWVEGAKIYYTIKYDGTAIEDVMIRLAIADSSAIAEDATYPIDPSMEQTIIMEALSYLLPNEARPQDRVADNKRTEQ